MHDLPTFSVFITMLGHCLLCRYIVLDSCVKLGYSYIIIISQACMEFINFSILRASCLCVSVIATPWSGEKIKKD